MSLRSRIVGVVVVVCIIGLLLLASRHSISNNAQDLRCKYRLSRLGRAVNLWMEDYRRTWHPPITNPQPQTLWIPGREKSAAEVLVEYLDASADDRYDFYPPRSPEKDPHLFSLSDARDNKKSDYNEMKDAYHARMREREMTVCPETGFEYWYHGGLLESVDFRSINNFEVPDASERARVWNDGKRYPYFSCQHTDAGLGPHEHSGEHGVYRVSAALIVRHVTTAEVTALEQSVKRIEARNIQLPVEEWTHDIVAMRERLDKFRVAAQKRPTGFDVTRLHAEVEFVPQDIHSAE